MTAGLRYEKWKPSAVTRDGLISLLVFFIFLFFYSSIFLFFFIFFSTDRQQGCRVLYPYPSVPSGVP